MHSDIGESIVGSYLRHVRACDLVLYNEFTGDQQGEVDVIGVKASPVPEVWLCEVATHIAGLQYDASAEKSRAKISAKIDRAKTYADRVFKAHQQHFELWSPRVPVGAMTTWMGEEQLRRQDALLEVDFIINDKYTNAVSELISAAKVSTKTTGEDAFRMLQILTHLRGRAAW